MFIRASWSVERDHHRGSQPNWLQYASGCGCIDAARDTIASAFAPRTLGEYAQPAWTGRPALLPGTLRCRPETARYAKTVRYSAGESRFARISTPVRSPDLWRVLCRRIVCKRGIMSDLPPSATVGQAAPDFTLESTPGKKMSLSE